MAYPMDETENGVLRVGFDCRLKLEFHGSKITSDGGFLPVRELDEALGLTDLAGEHLVDPRTGKNGPHGMIGLFRQSTFGRFGGYEDMNDADRLGHDPAMRWIVGGGAICRQAASVRQMGRFETEFLATDDNIVALANLSGQWIDRVHDLKPPKDMVLDMDSGVSPTHGDLEGTAYNGHFGCSCYHPLFLFNHMGDPERSRLRPGNVHSADSWRNVLVPVVERYKERQVRVYFRGDAAFASLDLFGTSRSRWRRSPCPTLCSETSWNGSTDCEDRPRRRPEQRKHEMTEGEVCLDWAGLCENGRNSTTNAARLRLGG